MRYNLPVTEGGYWVGGKITVALWICLLASAGCFSPGVQEGLACSESGSCPVGQVCVDSICILAGTTRPGIDVDAADNVRNPDARVLDADTSCTDSVQCGDLCEAQCISEFTNIGEAVFQPQVGCRFLRAQAWGAGGGHGALSLNNGEGGAGAGGYAMVELAVTDVDSFVLVVGAPGANGIGGAPGAGGIPGGGAGGMGDNRSGGGGGGFSGLFGGPIVVGNVLVMAGGGGGSGGGPAFPENTNGGAGGGSEGEIGSEEGMIPGGTQVSGHVPLVGGPGGNGKDGGGGGGAGWYGGKGGSGANDDAQGGGGGSGYVGAATVSDVVTGFRAIPGNATALSPGETTALPTFPGKVTLSCFADPPAP